MVDGALMAAADPLTKAYQLAEAMLEAVPEEENNPALAAVYGVVRLHARYIRSLIDKYDNEHEQASNGL